MNNSSNENLNQTGQHSILYILEFFPSHIHPNHINPIEYAIQQGAKVTIATSGRMGESYPSRIDELGLIRHTRYFPADSVKDLFCGYRHYLNPFAQGGREAYRGLSLLLLSKGWKPSGLRAWAKAILRAPLLASEFDLMHARVVPGAYEYLLVPKIGKIPLVVTFGGMPPTNVKRFDPKVFETAFESADIMLVNSAFAGKQLQAMGCPSGKIRVLFQGVRLDDFPFLQRPFPSDGKIVLLTVARLSKEKGIDFAISAVEKLCRHFPNIEYRVVGPGPERLGLENLVKSKGLENHVKFLGALNGSALTNQYQQAHIFLLPSIIVRDASGAVVIEEVQGVSMQEAQASGAIVVASNIGGIPECVQDGVSAFLVPDQDSEALANKVQWILERPEQWSVWQNKARAWVEERFGTEQIGRQLWKIYQELMKPNANDHLSHSKR